MDSDQIGNIKTNDNIQQKKAMKTGLLLFIVSFSILSIFITASVNNRKVKLTMNTRASATKVDLSFAGEKTDTTHYTLRIYNNGPAIGIFGATLSFPTNLFNTNVVVSPQCGYQLSLAKNSGFISPDKVAVYLQGNGSIGSNCTIATVIFTTKANSGTGQINYVSGSIEAYDINGNDIFGTKPGSFPVNLATPTSTGIPNITGLPTAIVSATPTITLGGPTLTPKPTNTPGPTLTPVPTNKICTTEARICPDGTTVGRTGPNCEFAPCPPITTPSAKTSVTLNLKLKFQGVLSRPSNNQNQINVRVRLAGGSLSQPTDYQTAVFTTNDNGIWSGQVSFVNVPTGGKYRIYVKGPKHLQKKICDAVPTETYQGTYRCSEGNITLNSGDNFLDFSGVYQSVGDLPAQDGFVNAYDIALVQNNLNRTDTDILALADLNFDGRVDTQDHSLVIAALSVRTDEE